MRRKVLTASLGLCLLAALAGCATDTQVDSTKTCFPGVARTDVNTVRAGDTVTVTGPGNGDCRVSFDNADRRITVAATRDFNGGQVYAKKQVIAGADGSFSVKLRLPKTAAPGRIYVGMISGISWTCPDNASCASPLRSIDLVTVGYSPNPSMSATPLPTQTKQVLK